MTDYAKLIRRFARPLEVQPTGQAARLKPLSEIRGVLFDVYGTMFISGSGDVGVAQDSGKADAFAAALTAAGYNGQVKAEAGVACLLATIRRHHENAHAAGIEFPEVDIVQVWQDCMLDLAGQGMATAPDAGLDWRQVAIEYECRTNPVWPMPKLVEVLTALRGADLTLGIISNAQFFTIELFQSLLGRSPTELEFEPELQIYSYEHGQAKPGLFLYELARSRLAKFGLNPQNIVYVGNDMLNDVLPAHRLGFRTALFAGDCRSLRMRQGDARVAGLTADLVLTDLHSLVGCLQ